MLLLLSYLSLEAIFPSCSCSAEESFRVFVCWGEISVGFESVGCRDTSVTAVSRRIILPSEGCSGVTSKGFFSTICRLFNGALLGR